MPSESQRLDAQPQSSNLPPNTTAQCLSHSIQHNNDSIPYPEGIYEMLKLAWLIQPTIAVTPQFASKYIYSIHLH